MSRIVVRNALFFGRARASRLVIPWATYTDPEVAHVGVTHDRATASDGRIDAITVDMDRVDRAVIDEETDGFITVYHERGRVRGVTIVAAHAAEMISAPALALAHGVTMGELSGAIFPYPTCSEALRKAGDEYRRRALTPRARRWLSRYFEWTRR